MQSYTIYPKCCLYSLHQSPLSTGKSKQGKGDSLEMEFSAQGSSRIYLTIVCPHEPFLSCVRVQGFRTRSFRCCVGMIWELHGFTNALRIVFIK